ncbi:S66 peptidase family protein [Paenactinomyces guangxiensis]|uniref:LD-carboxypeptidase n=1 Tax=Paenactinomyces guangxiensis TaxID=1490290 RepID=A0A7W1WQF7_9BACL|nr:S66 peptidase family protein [Paenactinomyces guangxiensis]MBA4494184.1 LD-carboxypeptidase [Paenactinomyces guangxiensis]MBH8590680.1 LD-carboxypeptidase [Paenactinomyces guangxiensis]
MIIYPLLQKGATIGVTAPSSGVQAELHDMFKLALSRMEKRGFKVVCGDTVWTQNKAKSSPAQKRADEFNQMMQDEQVNLIIPPWGGHLLIEMLEYVDFENINKKWLLGYSDTSVLLLAITLKTGVATAHGPNFVDLRGEYWDDTTAMWQTVLSTEAGGSVRQHSSAKYQREWQHHNPTPCVFHLTEQTCWKTASSNPVKIQGRLLGGCIDVIRHLIGTPFGDVQGFRKQFTNGESVLWYFENCDMTTTDLRRSLVQMKLAGWFEQCSGIMFGRSPANHPVENYTIEDIYQELSDELQIPIIYDIDCGHVPPQITLINGAYAEVEAEGGKGTVWQYFK